MVQYSPLEKFLRHRDLMLVTALISTLILTPNTYWVYYSMMKNFAPVWREIISGFVALFGVTLGILIYTIRGNERVSYYYMWFEISISTFYYIITIGWSWWLIPAFSFVFMLPVSLKNYTSELNKDKDKPNDDVKTYITDLERVNKEYSLLINELKAEGFEKSKDIHELKRKIDELISDFTFKSFDEAAYQAKIKELYEEISILKNEVVSGPKNIGDLSDSQLLNIVK
jgi:polyhydroxyalkanoate synthesis regulator phasin